jgi:hypothetical protein
MSMDGVFHLSASAPLASSALAILLDGAFSSALLVDAQGGRARADLEGTNRVHIGFNLDSVRGKVGPRFCGSGSPRRWSELRSGS